MAQTVKSHALVTINQSGDVVLSVMLSVAGVCMMDFTHFPFDTQRCSFVMESYMYITKVMTLVWTQKVDMAANAQVVNYQIANLNNSKKPVEFPEGEHDQLSFAFDLQSTHGHYIVGFYMPSFLLVTLSCLLFWLPVDSLTERSLFGAFLFLGMISIHQAVEAASPVTNYATKLDLWTCCCFFFMTIGLIEVIILGLVHRGCVPGGSWTHAKLQNGDDDLPPPRECQASPSVFKLVDRIMSVLYPAVWILFNIIYWSTI